MKHKDIYVKGRWVASIGIEKEADMKVYRLLQECKNRLLKTVPHGELDYHTDGIEALEWLRERGEYSELFQIAKPLSEIRSLGSY